MYTYRYPRPALTVDAIVLKRETNELLLIQRAKDPFAGKWALPGGFVEMGELLVDSCRRELEEETGLKLQELIQLKTYDAIDRDPRERIISVVFYGFADRDAMVSGADDALRAAWFPLDQLPELAFDHDVIISDFKAELIP
ncbi:NUDIX domain-containing protein [Gaoshiqia sp. Z1-71]|uniref:NUDIX domain-containing protein n=1 Tax=Gaoshiqia hydrogeniformans TaxID=3290090 RepID=UPI003BF82155